MRSQLTGQCREGQVTSSILLASWKVKYFHRPNPTRVHPKLSDMVQIITSPCLHWPLMITSAKLTVENRDPNSPQIVHWSQCTYTSREFGPEYKQDYTTQWRQGHRDPTVCVTAFQLKLFNFLDRSEQKGTVYSLELHVFLSSINMQQGWN